MNISDIEYVDIVNKRAEINRKIMGGTFSSPFLSFNGKVSIGGLITATAGVGGTVATYGSGWTSSFASPS
jgi:hypothetical protein